MPLVSPAPPLPGAPPAPVRRPPAPPPAARRGAWRWLRARPGALAAVTVLAGFALLALLAPLLAPYDPNALLDIATRRNQPPSLAHPLGTDPFSRDVLSRLLHGGRVSLAVAALATLLAATIGTGVGALAGWVGGRTDALLMRGVDALLAMPRLLVLIAVFALWPGLPLWALVVIIGATSWFPLSRMVRADVHAVRGRDFVVAARALGASEARLLLRHALPAVGGTVLVAATLLAGHVILLEAALSFLGAGVQPPQASWGSIVQDGMQDLRYAWWVSLFPGLAITAVVFAVNVLGDALRDAIDPRQLPQR